MGQVIDLDLHRALRQARRDVAYFASVLRANCCTACGGEGITTDSRQGMEELLVECRECNGTGRLV